MGCRELEPAYFTFSLVPNSSCDLEQSLVATPFHFGTAGETTMYQDDTDEK